MPRVLHFLLLPPDTFSVPATAPHAMLRTTAAANEELAAKRTAWKTSG